MKQISAVQDIDGPFLLKGRDESTRVKAMARNLKTPDSGLAPGLYEADSAKVHHHVPQVTLGEPFAIRTFTSYATFPTCSRVMVKHQYQVCTIGSRKVPLCL